MHDNRSHPLLEQVPLTVSPFINLPTATTLPYTYKTMPSTLPSSATGITAATTTTTGAGADDQQPPATKPRYVISQSGHAAHPDDIVASCRALQAHVAKLQADADAELQALDESIRARELAEKRRVAPGWLDSEARLLEPERSSGSAAAAAATSPATRGIGGGGGQMEMAHRFVGLSLAPGGPGHGVVSEMAAPVPDQGEELDRAFGGLGLGK